MSLASRGSLLQIFAEPDDSTFISAFQRLAESSKKGQDQGMASGTVLVLVQQYAAAAPENCSKELRKAHRKRVKAASRLLDAVPVDPLIE